VNRKSKRNKVSVIGLGYVGLPLALELTKYNEVIGYDLSNKRISNLINKFDETDEISQLVLSSIKNITFTSDKELMKNSDFLIITVPTPVNKKKEPDLKSLKDAANTVGLVISKGGIVIVESTVYPGVTEGIVAKSIEKASKLKYLKDFNMAYSPERINPGDNKYKLKNIKKLYLQTAIKF